MSCAVIRMVCAERRTLPSRTAPTLSLWATVAMSGCSLNENEEVRAATCNLLISARPLHRSERIRDKGLLVACTVNDDRHEERLLLGHMVGTFDGELPFVAKIALEPLLGMLGDHRNKERAVVDLVPDLLIPRVPAAQLALTEKALDP